MPRRRRKSLIPDYSHMVRLPRTNRSQRGRRMAYRASYRASKGCVGCLPVLAVLFIVGIFAAIAYAILYAIVSTLLSLPPIVYFAAAAILLCGLVGLVYWRYPSKRA